MRTSIATAGTSAYRSCPDDGEKRPGLIVIEEIWGVDEHIRSVADRFAAEGFSVIAPELLPEGLLATLTPQLKIDLFDPEKRNEVQPKLRAAMAPIMQPEYARSAIEKLKACVDYLLAERAVSGGIGVAGFCFGGSYSFRLAAGDKRIRAAVPFYGQAPAAGEIPAISCPVLAFYGDQDAALMQSLPQLKKAMRQHGKRFEAVVYQRAGHAFFNDTNLRAYNPRAARDAWKRTLAFLKKHLGAASVSAA